MSIVLIRMDGSEVVHKRTQQKHCKHRRSKTNNLRYLVIKKPSEEYPLKSEGHQNTTGPCSELTKTKLKERLEGKNAAIIILEDDGNNSFLHKSEGQDETTENSRNIRNLR